MIAKSLSLNVFMCCFDLVIWPHYYNINQMVTWEIPRAISVVWLGFWKQARHLTCGLATKGVVVGGVLDLASDIAAFQCSAPLIKNLSI